MILELPKIVCHCFHCFPIYLPWVITLDAINLVFWMLSFKLAFSLSSFTFKRLFSSSSLSAIKVVSSAYLRLLIFLPATLIPACASSSPVQCSRRNIMMSGGPPWWLRGLSPMKAPQSRGPALGRWTPTMCGFENQWGLHPGEPKGYGKWRLHLWRSYAQTYSFQVPAPK